MKAHYLLWMLLFLPLGDLSAQYLQRQTSANHGKSLTFQVLNEEYWVSQSVGQGSVIGAVQSTNYKAIQGFQQPILQIVDTGNNPSSNFLEIIVHPNPVTAIVDLTFSEKLATHGVVLLYDVLGRIILEKEFQPTSEESLDLSQLSAGTYLLKVSADAKSFTARIIKN